MEWAVIVGVVLYKWIKGRAAGSAASLVAPSDGAPSSLVPVSPISGGFTLADYPINTIAGSYPDPITAALAASAPGRGVCP